MEKLTILGLQNEPIAKHGWFEAIPLVKYTRSQNLGQLYNGVPKYHSSDKNGNNTGVGYAFEDWTKICLEKQGHVVEQVEPTYHGADFVIDGELCQLKCGKDGGASGRAFYKESYGPYSYEGQTAVVPKGHGKYAEEVFRMRDNNGLGRPDKVVESPATRKDAEIYKQKGLGSFAMDCTDPNLLRMYGRFGIGVAATGLCVDLVKHRKELDAKTVLKKTGKWTLIGLASSALSLLVGNTYRQSFRV